MTSFANKILRASIMTGRRLKRDGNLVVATVHKTNFS